MGNWLSYCTTTDLSHSMELWIEKIHPMVSDIWASQCLDPTDTRFEKFLAHGQTHMTKGKWPWHCTTACLDKSIEFGMEKIHCAVSEIWVPQNLDQPLACPPWSGMTIPLQPEGLRDKNEIIHLVLLEILLSGVIKSKIHLQSEKYIWNSMNWDTIFQLMASYQRGNKVYILSNDL